MKDEKILSLLTKNQIFWQAKRFDVKYHAELTSGLHSGEYYNLSNLNNVKCIKELLLAGPSLTIDGKIIEWLENSVDCVCGQAYGSIALAVILSDLLHVPFIFTEKDKNGQMIFSRFNPSKYNNVLLVEDVITTGSTTKQTLLQIGNERSYFSIFSIINRSDDVFFNLNGKFYRIDCIYKPNVTQVYEPDSCPYCKHGSKAVKGKQSFELLMEQENE